MSSFCVIDINRDSIPTDIWSYMRKKKVKHNNRGVKKTIAYGSELQKPSKITHLLNNAKSLLANNGMDADCTYGLVERHSYNVKGKASPIFDEHCDDHGGIDCAVSTVIYYLRKDPTIIGGDLLIEGILINCTPPDGAIRVVCLAGNVLHQVTQMSGKGNRECVVVQLRCPSR